MKKKIIAFYDLLLFFVICGPLMICSILIFILGKFNELEWIIEYWYFVLLFAVGIAVPMGGTLLFRYCIIENDSIRFHYFPFTTSWEKAANNIDILWNQNAFISEIENFEIVKLLEEEKQTKVYYKHWFNKYLKINLKNGNPKYVYVGNYSDGQIKKIIQMVKLKKTFKC